MAKHTLAAFVGHLQTGTALKTAERSGVDCFALGGCVLEENPCEILTQVTGILVLL